MREQRIAQDALLIERDSDHLVVVFGSFASLFSQSFELYSFYVQRPHDTLVLRDHTQLAFHGGFNGLTNDFDENIEFLKELIRHRSPSRVTFAGISSGGHAAMVHGAFIGIDDVLAINPVTTFDPDIAQRIGLGQRVTSQYDALSALYPRDHPKRCLLDARTVLQANPDKIGLIGVHYGASDPMDTGNAAHIADLPAVEAVAHHNSMHCFLVDRLIDQGVLAYHLETGLEELRAEYRAFA